MFSEFEDQLNYPGVWLSVLLTFAFSTAHFSLWFFYMRKQRKTKQEDDGYSRMHENGHANGNQYTFSLISIMFRHSSKCWSTIAACYIRNNSNSLTKQRLLQMKSPKFDRATVMEHLGKIFRFTFLQWKWFTGAFFFLLIYSGARIFIPYYTGQVIAEIVGAETRQRQQLRALDFDYGWIDFSVHCLRRASRWSVHVCYLSRWILYSSWSLPIDCSSGDWLLRQSSNR